MYEHCKSQKWNFAKDDHNHVEKLKIKAYICICGINYKSKAVLKVKLILGQKVKLQQGFLTVSSKFHLISFNIFKIFSHLKIIFQLCNENFDTKEGVYENSYRFSPYVTPVGNKVCNYQVLLSKTTKFFFFNIFTVIS